MSESEEIGIGRQMDPQIIEQYGLYDDLRLQEYVNTVGKKVSAISHRPELVFHFKVVDSPVVNAFALPGGYIYVTRGILAWMNSEAELASVLGHEIGHVTSRHAVKQITKVRGYQILSTLGAISSPQYRTAQEQFGDFFNILFTGIMQGYGRSNEFQADSLGIEYAHKAGYDPSAAVSFMKTLNRLEEKPDNERDFFERLFASHPPTSERIERNEEQSHQLPSSHTELIIRHSNEYKLRINGLLYGYKPGEGIIDGNLFKHKLLRFEMAFPQGWKIMNEKTKVIAKDPHVDHVIQLTHSDLSKNVSPQVFAQNMVQKSGLKLITGKPTTINSLEAFEGTAEGYIRSMGTISVKLAFIFMGDKAYHLIAWAPKEEFPTVEDIFKKTLFSFRPLSISEAERIKGQRIKVYKIKKGDSLASIARKELGKAGQANDIAKLNGLELNDSLREGDLLKIITSKVD